MIQLLSNLILECIILYIYVLFCKLNESGTTQNTSLRSQK